MMNANILKLKEELKNEAVEIRNAKEDLKALQRTGSGSSEMYALQCMREDNRHKHVAYSLSLGRSYEQIEPKVREGNEISWYRIEKIQASYGLPVIEQVAV